MFLVQWKSGDRIVRNEHMDAVVVTDAAEAALAEVARIESETGVKLDSVIVLDLDSRLSVKYEIGVS